MKDKEFDIKMEKISDAPDKTSSKYAIIGYFRSKQQEAIHQPVVRTANTTLQQPTSTISNTISNPVAIVDNIATSTKRELKHRSFCILSKSTAEQWLLALIAFLLFIHLLCRA